MFGFSDAEIVRNWQLQAATAWYFLRWLLLPLLGLGLFWLGMRALEWLRWRLTRVRAAWRERKGGLTQDYRFRG